MWCIAGTNVIIVQCVKEQHILLYISIKVKNMSNVLSDVTEHLVQSGTN